MSCDAPSPKQPTIADVAGAAGVSRTTVSHALNDIGQVAPQTRRHVKKVAARLGYRPNVRAQRLRTGRSSAIALLSSMPPAVSAGASRLGFFTELAMGCAEAALLRGYFLALAPPTEGVEALGILDIDGAILLEPAPHDPIAHELHRQGTPYVAIGATRDGVDDLVIDLRHHEIADLLFNHLRDQGAQHIGLVIGDSNRASQAAFRRRYLAVAENMGFTVALVEAAESGGEAAGYAATLQLLERHPGVDALCVPIDAFASGAARAASSHGRRIGHDLLLATRYNGLRARAASPPLTAVDLHLPAVSQLAVDLLLSRIGGGTNPHHSAQPQAPELVVRASTCIPKTTDAPS